MEREAIQVVIKEERQVIRNGKRKQKTILPGLMVISIIFLLLFPLSTLRGEYDEYQLKATLLALIAKQVEWPKSAGIENKHEPFVIGIFGENPFGTKLEDYYVRKHLKPRKIKDKLVEIKYIKRMEETPTCHILFIADLPKRSLDKIVSFIQDKPVLTISDVHDYVERGVHINLLIRKGSINKRNKNIPTIDIIINESAMRLAGLVPSKYLQEISEVIHPYSPYEEKARQLAPIARFITWPKESEIADHRKPFTITVLGKNFFENYLEKIYKKKKIKDKTVDIRYITTVDEISDTNLLFISNSLKNHISEIVAFTKDKPILTVGDTKGFTKQGVHVNFFYRQLRLYFEINQDAAAAAGFKISYHLLKMARLDTEL